MSIRANFIIKHKKQILSAPPSKNFETRRSVIIFRNFEDAVVVNKLLSSSTTMGWSNSGTFCIKQTFQCNSNQAKVPQRSIHAINADPEDELLFGHTHMDLYIVESVEENNDTHCLRGFFQETLELKNMLSDDCIDYFRDLIQHEFINDEVKGFIHKLVNESAVSDDYK